MNKNISKQEPFLTVFTPNYNRENLISETIESILNQTYSNFEYIIIDDGSTDNSWKIIQTYAKKDERIKPYRNEKNLGIVKTRNRGFKLSSKKSKYFAIIDSDDIAILNRLELQVDFLEQNPNYGLVGSSKYIINKDSRVIGFRDYPTSNKKIKKVITRYNPIAQSSVLLRKEVIKKIGKYDEKWGVCQDYDYWLRVGRDWKLKNLDIPLIKYRLGEDQVKFQNIAETIKFTCKIQEKAIRKYGYSDNIFNKIYRKLLFFSLIYPKFTYFLYRIRFSNFWL
ncbi:MAG: glycosyltransferase [Promethearchaeota archaeon]|nr:MAG: glycosyltransferase [Candidatus Lokiarchaeota archaeon]